MAIFKEVVRGDGSGIAEYYRVQDGRVMNVDYSMVTNKPTLNGVTLAGDLTTEDFGMDIEGAVETMTGEEISRLGEDANKIVLCTSDYLYTDRYGVLTQTERGTIYEIAYGTIVDKISVSGSGSGGGGGIPRSNFSAAVSELEQNVSVNAKVDLQYKFVTTAIPNTGTAQLLVNGVMKSNKAVVSGNTYSFNVSSYLKPGINYFSIKTSDSNGAEKTLDFIVNAMQLTISSSFDVSTIINQTFDFRYRVKGTGDKVIHFILDNEETTVESNLNDVDLTKQFQSLSHGEHSLEVYATVTLDDGELTSNILNYRFLAVDPASSTPLILSTFDKTECTEGDSLAIDYLIYSPSTLISDAQLLINDDVKANIKADRFRHVWNVSDYPSGTTTFSILANGVRVDKIVEVAKLDIDIKEATEGLELYLTAKNRSNDEADETKTTWKYGDIEAELTGFNWETNGWIDNKLKLSGPAQVSIPFYPFNKDVRKNGKTIEIEFTTHDVFNLESTLARCTDEGKGFEIKSNNSFLGSEQTNVATRFADGIKIRISFVIESDTSNRLIKTYINGILSGLKQYSSTDNFQQNTPSAILLNPDSEEIDISCIRVYDRALSSTEIVNNYIFDIADNEEKIAKFKENAVYDAYNEISYAKLKTRMPIVTVTGEMPTSKGNKKTVSVQFENVNDEVYNFQFDNCTIDVQGTSSQYYPRKNWKIKLPEKIQVWDNAIAEDTYTMKADFMESSHTNNVGTAKLANTLYNENFPTKVSGSNVRDAIYGFPCAMFLKDTESSQPIFHGTYMFNNDKGNSDTLGLTTDKSESWEFKNNTSDLCLFKTDDFTADDVADNLEARYPDKYTNYTALNRVFSWVVSCKNDPEKFKKEFKNYFNLEYCLVYQVLMEMAMLVDSRAKNMFLDTTDGLIWYPRFYDMDTAWGLNNEGELKWSYDIEIHDKSGSAYVWDERGESVFWNLFEQAYADEIIDKYHELRESKLTYENIMKFYIEDISSKFSASEYNEDAQFKYVGPLTDENNSTYLYAAQGNRQDFFRWLVENRLHYLDSKYEYGDFNSDYATMRLYTKEGSLTLSTYITEYVAVKYGSTIVKDKVIANTPKIIPAPAGLEFNDTETIIYGASQITDFGDLSDKYPGTVDISKCSKLQRLKIGSENKINTNLISISLGNNPLLREIDVTNCPNLTGDLDLSNCFDLRVVKAAGTNLSSITLCDGGNIEELYLPDSVTTLKLVNLQNLKVIDGNNFSNLKTIIFSNCSYDIQELLCKCPNLNRLNVYFGKNQNITMDAAQIMYYHNYLLGVDDLGYNTDKPNISGYLNITMQDYLTDEEKEEYKSIIRDTYADLEVTYENVPSMFSFAKVVTNGTTTNEYRRTEKCRLLYDRVAVPSRTSYSAVTQTNNTKDPIFYLIYKNSNNLPKGNVFLPEKYRGYPIYSFYQNAFTDCIGLKSITVPNTYKLFDNDFLLTEYNLLMSASSHGIYSNFLESVYSSKSGTYLNTSYDGHLTFSGCSELITVAWKLHADNIIFHSKIFGNCPKLKYIADLDKVKGFSSNWANKDTLTTVKTLDKRKFNLSGAEMMFFPQTNTISSDYSYYRCNSLDFIFNFPNIKYTNYGYSLIMNYDGDVDLSNVEYIGVYDYNESPDNNPYYLHGGYTPIFVNSNIKYLKLNDKFPKIPLNHCTVYNHCVEGIDHIEYLTGGSTQYSSISYLIKDTSIEDPFVFKNVKKLGMSMFKNYTNSNFESQQTDCTDSVSFPNLEEIVLDSTSGAWIDTWVGCGVLNIITPKDRFIKLKAFEENKYHTKYEFLLMIHANDCEMLTRGFDCSECKYGFELGEFSLYHAKSFGGFIDIGKAYDPANGAEFASYTLTWQMRYQYRDNGHDLLVTLLNGLYDLASAGIPPQKIIVGSAGLGLLTEDEIAIATNKGWNIS